MGFDHRPILTHVVAKKFFGNNSFHFDKHWLSKPNFDTVIKEGWLNVKDNSEPILGDQIKNCRAHISRWRKKDQHNSSEIIDNLKTRLNEAQSGDLAYAEAVSGLKEQLRMVLVEEETLWRQKKLCPLAERG